MTVKPTDNADLAAFIFNAFAKSASPEDFAEAARIAKSEDFGNPAATKVEDNWSDPKKTITPAEAGSAGGTTTAATGGAAEAMIGKYSHPAPQMGITMDAMRVAELVKSMTAPMMKSVSDLSSIVEALAKSLATPAAVAASVVKAEEPKKDEDKEDEMCKSMIAKAEAILAEATGFLETSKSLTAAGFVGADVERANAGKTIIKALPIVAAAVAMYPTNEKIVALAKAMEDMKEELKEKKESKEEVGKAALSAGLSAAGQTAATFGEDMGRVVGKGAVTLTEIMANVKANGANAQQIAKALPSIVIAKSAGGIDNDRAAVRDAYIDGHLSEAEEALALDLVAMKHSSNPNMIDMFSKKLVRASEKVQGLFSIPVAA